MCPCSDEYVWCVCGCAICKYVCVGGGGEGGNVWMNTETID